MQLLVGKILKKMEKIFPNFVMWHRVLIADKIISVNTVDIFGKYKVINKLNKFLLTMDESDRVIVMKKCGIAEAPAWNRLIHTGDDHLY